MSAEMRTEHVDDGKKRDGEGASGAPDWTREVVKSFLIYSLVVYFLLIV